MTVASPAAAELRKVVETGQFYLRLAAVTALRSCSVGADGGKVAVDYMFADGGQLHVERDARIEYTLQEARFATPQSFDPVGVLQAAERDAFGAEGCGINWQHGEAVPGGDDPAASETMYRGDVCNCQARVRHASGGGVVGLLFRSAC